MNFIKWPTTILDELDNLTTKTLCRTFKIPNFIPNQFWYKVKGLKSIKDINHIRYHSTIIDRTINSSLSMKTLPTYYNHITNPILNSTSLPPITLLLKNLQIQTLSPSSTPYTLPMTISHNENFLEVFTDVPLHLKSLTGSCAIYIPAINFKHTFPPHLPASSTHLELQAILYAILICRNIYCTTAC